MERVIVAAGGDVSTGFEPPQSGFTHVMEPLRSADVRFAQVERLYSERGSFQETALHSHARQHPRKAADFKSVPFDVLSIGSNHTGDWGPEAVEDTAETFRKLGIPTVGAGRNIAEARKAVVLERKGLRIAFLGYVSVVAPQYWATQTRAGSAPMRARTYYEPYEFQPGAPARVATTPYEEDLELLVRDVRQAKQDADVVFVSMHWGLHWYWRPTDYQPVVAHAAIDAGATAILGHHPHQMQGIELYQGGVIFYSIGNFSFWQIPGGKSGHPSQPRAAPSGEYTFDEIYTLEPDPGFVFHFKRHFNEGGIAFLEVDRQGLARASFLPTLMNPFGQPEVVRPGEPQFAKSLEYLNWAGKFIAGGATQIKAAGDRYEVFKRAG
ncbi:MAG: CapA family protein [Betaproteobacteria bacterium]|nr:CapA family protein [Betaproteobacteria bacterium]